jgi:hypothetical protein
MRTSGSALWSCGWPAPAAIVWPAIVGATIKAPGNAGASNASCRPSDRKAQDHKAQDHKAKDHKAKDHKAQGHKARITRPGSQGQDHKAQGHKAQLRIGLPPLVGAWRQGRRWFPDIPVPNLTERACATVTSTPPGRPTGWRGPPP